MHIVLLKYMAFNKKLLSMWRDRIQDQMLRHKTDTRGKPVSSPDTGVSRQVL